MNKTSYRKCISYQQLYLLQNCSYEISYHRSVTESLRSSGFHFIYTLVSHQSRFWSIRCRQKGIPFRALLLSHIIRIIFLLQKTRKNPQKERPLEKVFKLKYATFVWFILPSVIVTFFPCFTPIPVSLRHSACMVLPVSPPTRSHNGLCCCLIHIHMIFC